MNKKIKYYALVFVMIFLADLNMFTNSHAARMISMFGVVFGIYFSHDRLNCSRGKGKGL